MLRLSRAPERRLPDLRAGCDRDARAADLSGAHRNATTIRRRLDRRALPQLSRGRGCGWGPHHRPPPVKESTDDTYRKSRTADPGVGRTCRAGRAADHRAGAGALRARSAALRALLPRARRAADGFLAPAAR